MARFVISEAAQVGIQGAIREKIEYSEEYQTIMSQADIRIEEGRSRYADAYRKASTYLAQ